MFFLFDLLAITTHHKFSRNCLIKWTIKHISNQKAILCIYIVCKTRKNCFRYLKLMSPLKNNYLTLRSKVKVPRRSLR